MQWNAAPINGNRYQEKVHRHLETVNGNLVLNSSRRMPPIPSITSFFSLDRGFMRHYIPPRYSRFHWSQGGTPGTGDGGPVTVSKMNFLPRKHQKARYRWPTAGQY
jgi:hypothetical protein